MSQQPIENARRGTFKLMQSWSNVFTPDSNSKEASPKPWMNLHCTDIGTTFGERAISEYEKSQAGTSLFLVSEETFFHLQEKPTVNKLLELLQNADDIYVFCMDAPKNWTFVVATDDPLEPPHFIHRVVDAPELI